jgi:hypothetical protein
MVLTANGSGSGNWDKGSDSVKFEISFTAASFAAQRNPTPFAKTSPHHRWTRLKHAAIAPGTSPISGRKHQLRVHMAALGAPIANDGMYPSVRQREPGDYSALAVVGQPVVVRRSAQRHRTLVLEQLRAPGLTSAAVKKRGQSNYPFEFGWLYGVVCRVAARRRGG